MTEPFTVPDNVCWVWFDLDDTLYDFSGNSDICLGEVYDMARLDRWWDTVSSWREHYHRINHELWELYAPGLIDRATLRRERFVRPLTEAGCPTAEAEELWPELDRLYLGLLGQKSATIPGAVEVVRRMRARGKKIGVLSNGFKEVQYSKLSSIGLSHLVDCVVLSDEIDINKPDKRFFDYALAKSGATGADSLLVGDNPDTDIAGALAAGWRALWLAAPEAIPTETLEARSQIAKERYFRTSALDDIL